MSNAREEILEKLINHPLNEPVESIFDKQVFHPLELPLDKEFRKNLELIGGKVYITNSEADLAEYLKNLLSSYQKHEICCREPNLTDFLDEYLIQYSNYPELPENLKVGITGCEFLIAQTGSVMVSSKQTGGRQLFVYPPVHIVIARKQQLVDYLAKAYELIVEKYKEKIPSHIALITGASRTADIEKTLVMGAHGPKDLHVFVI